MRLRNPRFADALDLPSVAIDPGDLDVTRDEIPIPSADPS
jgi:hypothetical protein